MKVKLNFTAEELKSEIRRVWRTIPDEKEMDNLVLSFPGRAQRMVGSGGEDCQR
jgi:hypothetical protein